MGNKTSAKKDRELGDREKKVKQICEYNYDQYENQLRLSEQEYWADVLQSKDWSKLNQLLLYNCKIDDNSLKYLLNKKWTSLNILYLEQNKITLEGVELFIKHKWPSLKSINFNRNQIGDKGFLLVLKHLEKRLEQFSVNYCGITIKSIHQAMNYKTKNIKKLFIEGSLLGNNGAKCLTKIDMPNLQNLSIYYCGISEQGIKHLSKGKWYNLKYLYWQNYSLCESQYKKLSNNLTLNNLQMLNCCCWKLMESFEFQWIQPIFFFNGLLLQSKNIQIWPNQVYMKNQQFMKSIQKIFQRKFEIRPLILS